MSRTVVIALDQSDLSARALPFAERVAQQWRGRLVLVHALGAHEHAPAAAELALRGLATDLNAMGLATDVVMRRESAAAAITNVANERGADLVVMASHQRRGANRWLRGSVTEDVLAGTSTPLLVIPGQGSVRVARPGMRVLVPLDGTPTGEAALDFLRERSTSGPTDVVLIRVISYGPAIVGLGPALSVQGLSPSELEAEVDEARGYLTEVASDIQGSNLRLRHTIVESAHGIADVILETAQREQSDLIALGTHAKAGLSRLVLGSVSEEVLERSTVPVLLVHRKSGSLNEPAPQPRAAVAGSLAT